MVVSCLICCLVSMVPVPGVFDLGSHSMSYLTEHREFGVLEHLFWQVDAALESGSVLVSCKQGANRTGAFLGMYVMLKAGISASDAQGYLRTVRAIVDYDTPGPRCSRCPITVLDELRKWSRSRHRQRPTQSLPTVLRTKEMTLMANQPLARTMACCSLLQSSRVSLF